MNTIRGRAHLAVLILGYGIAQSTAQVATSTPLFGTFGGGPDVINLGNLNAHLTIPIVSKAGRGQNFIYNLGYDTSVWSPVVVNSVPTWQPAAGWGWQGLSPSGYVYIGYNETYTSGTCGQYGQNTWQSWSYTNLVYSDQNGVVHRFPDANGSYVSSNGAPPYCPPTGSNPPSQETAGVEDGSGLMATFQVNSTGYSATVSTSNRTVINAPVIVNFSNPSGNYSSTDSNGNEITATNGTYTDTLGTQVLAVIANSSTLTTLSYTAPSGGSAEYQVNFTQYTVRTDFNAGPAEYGPSSIPLVSSISLPDGTSYSFTYEQTPGTCTPLANTYSANCVTARLAEVTLPTGGTISYTYQGGPGSTGILSDGSTAGLRRTLVPGGMWFYSRALQSGSPGPGSTWTTTTTDPANNQTVMNFAEDNDSTSTYSMYETEKKVYQGNASSGTLLSTNVICYNATFTNCATAKVSSPITQTDAYTVLPNNLTRLSELTYNGALVTIDNEYDFGVSQGAAPGIAHLIQQTTASYNSLGEPSQVTVDDWSTGSSVQLASTTYSYDQSSVTATSGTPQHVAATGSRGNLTTLAQVANSGTTLYQTFSYYDTGNLNTSTGLSTSSSSPGPTTTYVYGSGSCGNSFVTQLNEPLNLSRSYIWNCTGGVQTQITDENGQAVKTTYSDSDFWRPANVYDQENNEALSAYSGQTEMGATMTFNNNQSVSSLMMTVDGFGRPILKQRLQGPGASNYDTVETDYNSVGLISRVTMPFSAVAGGTNSSVPGVNSTYDALGRLRMSTDNDGGAVTYTYTNNLVSQATSGSQTFQKLFQYDGLGRLTGVCEISSTLPLTGACGTTGQTGYWTAYTYDALGRLLTVTQNAQAASGSQQKRSYSYDQLGRLTSESNPETSNTSSNGTINYTYDVACTTTGASPGDLTRRVDNAGVNTCYGYDSLHRPNAQGWNTVCRFFNYDTNVTPPSGVTVQNTKARLLEAYTTNCGSSRYTDEWFGYSPRGELTDVYETTPNSGSTYYHTSAGYWPNGTLETLSGVPSMPALYYGASNNRGAGLDGEGRLTQVTANSGQGPISGVTYSTSSSPNYLGALTAVTYGSSDNDGFSYDSNTGRVGSYTFSVNGQTDTGQLNWNSNGSLGSLGITDNISGTTDTENCTFTYDDLGRIGGKDGNGYSVDCGSKWQQLFTYDAFGNIVKSGTSSFMANYPYPNNHFTISGANVQYDANGNLLTDNLNTYTWDPNWGNMTAVNGNTATYDAFGQVVEQKTGSSYRQIIYSPIGKTALMSGSSLIEAFASLPGGGTAIYNSSGLAYYRHSDWLGSSRLTSTSSRGIYSDSSYAPFGEQYAVVGSSDSSFTGQNSDTVPSLYDFLYRRLSPSQGRWISPDPSGGSAVDITNPQSFNRYSYVQNTPLSLIDPLGLWCAAPAGYGDSPCNPANSGGGGDGEGGGYDGFSFLNFFSPVDYSDLNLPIDYEGPDWDGYFYLPAIPGFGWTPNNPTQQQNACSATILSAVNKQFGTNFAPSDVQGNPWDHGEGININILGANLPAAQFNSLQTGRYPLNWYSYLIGYGPTLHVTGTTQSDPLPAFFANSNVGGQTSVLFTAHIDTSFAYNPIGFLIHLIRDILHIGGPRKPCPS